MDACRKYVVERFHQVGTEAICFREIDGKATIEECDATIELLLKISIFQRRISILFEDDTQGATLL